MTPKISLCAAAARPAYWERFYNSVLNNTIEIEIVFVGPNPPTLNLPDNFKWIYSEVKPSQAYEIAFRNSNGELKGWTADDANYNHPDLNCPNALDLIWNRYEESKKIYSDNKTILAMCPREDSSAEWFNHHFFYGIKTTPRMAPFGFINGEWFNKLGGYDRNFICGQSENDIVMRGLQDGGRVQVVEESKVHVHHAECHGNNYPFRKGYDSDRKFLEECWIKEGYGTYEVLAPYNLSLTRLRPVDSFSDTNILIDNQGPAGIWAKEGAKV